MRQAAITKRGFAVAYPCGYQASAGNLPFVADNTSVFSGTNNSCEESAAPRGIYQALHRSPRMGEGACSDNLLRAAPAHVAALERGNNV